MANKPPAEKEASEPPTSSKGLVLIFCI